MWRKETEIGSKGPWGSKKAGAGTDTGPALKMEEAAPSHGTWMSLEARKAREWVLG